MIVEDEPAVARGVQVALEREGYAVSVQPTGEDAIANFADTAPDLVVLDVRLPGIDGFEVLRQLRRETRAPVLFLTARADEVDKVVGLEMGADDYLVKPFSVRELVSRIKALLRRAYGELADTQTGRTLRRGDLVIDLERRRVTRDGERIGLTTTEFDLLRHLASRPGPGLHPRPAARAGPRLRRRPRAGRADDQRPHQPHPRQGRARPVAASLHPDGEGRRLCLRRGLTRRRVVAVEPDWSSFDPRGLPALASRLNVRLVLALVTVTLVGLIMSAIAIQQILPGFFAEQTEQRIDTASGRGRVLDLQGAVTRVGNDPETRRMPRSASCATRGSCPRWRARPLEIFGATVTIINDLGAEVARASRRRTRTHSRGRG